MLSIEEVKKILKDETLSNEEAEIIRNECYDLAEISLEKYQTDKKALFDI